MRIDKRKSRVWRRRVVRGLALACAWGAALHLGGCGAVTSQRLEVALPTEPAPLAVDVSNPRGSVEIRVDARVESPRIVADVQWARGVEDDRARKLAKSITIESSVEQGPGGAVLRVRARDEVKDLPKHWANLRIVLPRVDGVRVVSSGGDVILAGVSGAVQVENGDGAIELRTDKPVTAPVALIATRGNVYFQAPVGSRGVFDMQTGAGEAAFVSRSVLLRDMRATRSSIMGVLAAGDNPITLRSDRGDVRAWVIEKPMALVRAFR